MLRGLSVSVEMNGGLILDTADTITRSFEATGDHCTSTVTSVSTASGSVTLQVEFHKVPSYNVPLGTLRCIVGVGTGGPEDTYCIGWVNGNSHVESSHNTYS